MYDRITKDGIEVYTWKIGSSTYNAAPLAGARLMQWTIATFQGNRNVIHWPQNADFSNFAKIRGGNPILFPFAARSFDRGIENAWRDPSGTRRNMPRHGFARDGSFELEYLNETGFKAILNQTNENFEAYPFQYQFAVEYIFQELALTCRFILFNKDTVPIPWSAGHHFYFCLPWHKDKARRDYRLCMEPKKAAYVGPGGKLVMEKSPISLTDLGDSSLIDRVHWQMRHSRISFGPKSGEEDVHLIIDKNPVPKKNLAVVTWSESEDAPYYCIEPWMGPPNAPEHGKGLHWVNPNDSASFDIEVSLY